MGYGQAIQTTSFQHGDWVWWGYQPVSAQRKTSQQRSLAGISQNWPCYRQDPAPKIVHVDKLLPCQADYGEELQSWLEDGGIEVA